MLVGEGAWVCTGEGCGWCKIYKISVYVGCCNKLYRTRGRVGVKKKDES
jgi:hypothetical protein